ncbi:uncharacterized protein LOC126895408 [Daktulosphaira vitifoliae]|uniref:uncharacterized protein LOC126895408 n=1 Tax=Daktulosphaira vitifoliae TaxID=58002 RepID=UPI0021AA36EB|nr:uncharacterized protein LOC126895408 [Daktulosphaira vitifoliae]XP_050523200.1 uncharacterized protein LOC126895408 [Daktulosphaira vitifoliae]
MNFNDLHCMAKKIDLQVKTLEAKVANPMGMIYSNNSSQGVKILSLLKDMVGNIEEKKKIIESTIYEQNNAWSEMIEDYNFIAKYKSDINDKLDELENTWSNQYPCYKPFIPTNTVDTIEIDTEFQELHLQEEEKQLADQSLNDNSLCNITLSQY